MIDVEVHYTRGDFTINATIRDSGFIGLTGPNGSGKSSLLRIIAGVQALDSGHIWAGGSDLTGLPISERKVIYLNQDTYFGHATVDKHLLWGAGRETIITAEQLEQVRNSLGITYSGKVSTLSLGQRGRVILGTALLSRPRLILIDELFANMSDRNGILRYLSETANSTGVDIIFVSQDAEDLKLSDSAYFMDRGRLEKMLP